MRIAAIDQGTTSTRSLVIGEDGAASICHALRHRQIYPQPGWVEHDPLELLANVRDCLAATGVVDAVGLANQGESCLAWDAKTKQPLSPVIVWQDNRTSEFVAKLKADGAEELTMSRAGLPLDPYFSASKLGWILTHVADARAALSAGRLRLGTTDAYFLDRLAGAFVTDATTASRTSLMNLETGRWDADLCELFRVPIDTLPEIRPTIGEFGDVNGARVAASVVDQQAALYGHGCRHPGDAKITFGTGAFALAVTGSEVVRAPEKGLLPTIAWRIGDEATFAVEGGVYDAGAAIEWVKRLGLFDDFSELNAFDAPAAIDRGLAFVPALSGLACPHWDRSAAALWIGMSADTTRRDLRQAALEGVALRAAEVISAMAERAPIGQCLSIDGGLTRSAYFVQFLADALGRSVATPPFDELTALGCAELAAAGVGSRLPPRGDDRAIHHPRIERQSQWREKFADAVARSRAWR